jgi:hypothetical protein
MRFHKNPDNRMVQLLEVLVFVSHCLLHGSVLVLYPEGGLGFAFMAPSVILRNLTLVSLIL